MHLIHMGLAAQKLSLEGTKHLQHLSDIRAQEIKARGQVIIHRPDELYKASSQETTADHAE